MAFLQNLLAPFARQHRPIPVPAPKVYASLSEVIDRSRMDAASLAAVNNLSAMTSTGRVAAEALGLTVVPDPRNGGFTTMRTAPQALNDWRLVHVGRTEREVYAALGIEAMCIATVRNNPATMSFVSQEAVRKLEEVLPRQIEAYSSSDFQERIAQRLESHAVGPGRPGQ